MKKVLTIGAVALIATMFLSYWAGSALATKPNPDHKVDVCHRTGSATNPYVFINVDIASSGYVKQGHTYHEQVGNGLGGDIIAAYTYEMKNGDTFVFEGKNLDTVIGGSTGAEILANGCVIPTGTPTTPPPTTVPPTTPPPTTVPPTVPPTKPPHTGGPKWTPTWSPTWTPPRGGPGEHPLAFTGGEIAVPAAAGAILLTTGLGTLWFLRRRSA